MDLCTQPRSDFERGLVHKSMIIRQLAVTTGGTFEGGEDRHGRENGRKRSIGGPEGPPVAHLGSKTWRQRDLPGVKAQQDATECTEMG